MSRNHFPRVSRLRRGYDRRQVDAYLNQLDVALRGALPMPTAAAVRQVGFELARGGYRTESVDSALDTIEERLLMAQSGGGGRRGRVDATADAAFLTGELSAPHLQRFPRAGALHRGYHVGDVDDLVDRVVAALTGSAMMTADEVRTAAFRALRGGYREDAVDDTLDRVVEVMLLLRQQAGGRPTERSAT